MKTPWIYIAPDLVDCGFLGTNQLTFIAWVLDDKVEIERVNLSLICFDDVEIDVTQLIKNSFYTKEKWEAEILEHFKRAQIKEFKDSQL